MDVQTITGTRTNPFFDLEDAITKAYELAAPYVSANITILLIGSRTYRNTHYLLRDYRDYY